MLPLARAAVISRLDNFILVQPAWAILHQRRKVPPNETAKQKREHPQRESRLWPASFQASNASNASGAMPKDSKDSKEQRDYFWVDVADHGADTFEFLVQMHQAGGHYMIRCARNRALAGEDHVAADRIHHYLLGYTRDLPTLGEQTVEVKRQQKTQQKTKSKPRR